MDTKLPQEKKNLVSVTTNFVSAAAVPRAAVSYQNVTMHEQLGTVEIFYRSASLLPEMALPGKPIASNSILHHMCYNSLTLFCASMLYDFPGRLHLPHPFYVMVLSIYVRNCCFL